MAFTCSRRKRGNELDSRVKKLEYIFPLHHHGTLSLLPFNNNFIQVRYSYAGIDKFPVFFLTYDFHQVLRNLKFSEYASFQFFVIRSFSRNKLIAL